MVRISSLTASSRRLVTAQLADQALADLLTSRSLRAHKLARHCPIGPYVLDYVYSERALVVELGPERPVAALERAEADPRTEGRHRFLAAMGYTVLCLSRDDVLKRPMLALGQIQAALR